MAQRIEMNRQMGTAWFTFFTKVRPWIGGFFALAGLAQFAQYFDVYISNVGLLFSFIISIVQVILGIMVAVKAEDDYGDFVRFVKGVLIFETVGIALQQGIQQYYQNDNSLLTAVIVTAVILLLDYLVWYRLNMKYFTKRMMRLADVESRTVNPTVQRSLSYENETPVRQYGSNNVYGQDIALVKEETAPEKKAVPAQPTMPPPPKAVDAPKMPLRFCSHCGSAVDPITKKCTGCGKQYFKGISWKAVLISVLAIGLAVSIFGNIMQSVANAELSAEVTQLKKNATTLSKEASDLKDDVKELEKENEDYYNYWVETFEELAFYDEFVVFVEDDGTKLYHKYDCYKFTGEYFWAYNVDAAEDKGYSPCSHCCD